jgi:hypothetical protein
MKKTRFLTTLLTSVMLMPAVASMTAAQEGNANPGQREFYELRVYSFDSPNQQAMVADYWANAAIPALNRQGIRPIGLFQETVPQEGQELGQIVVLIPYRTLSQFAASERKLERDKEYLKAAAAYLHAPRDNSAYKRIESHLLQAMKVQPNLSAPDISKKRIFEMREYEGHSEAANANKIAMFDEVEADIFAESGLTAVFYAKTLIGKNRPSLRYMVTFDDEADQARDWASFRENPRWAAARDDPKWKEGGVSGRTTFMLMPLKGSQL